MVHINLLADMNEPMGWGSDWLWGLPLIVITVLIHVQGINAMKSGVNHFSSYALHNRSRHRNAIFVVIVGGATLGATVLLGIEAGIWSYAYLFLHALADRRMAMLYSLNAITSFGHTDLHLEKRWELLGALESLNGWLLFGLSTAFLFAVIAKIGSLDRSVAGHEFTRAVEDIDVDLRRR